jgi:hypothetical protein
MNAESRQPAGNSPAPGQTVTIVRRFCAILMVAGLAALLFGPAAFDADQSPSVLLANFLFWSGLACGLLAWAAILWIARASWAAAVTRIGHSGLAFLPVSLALLAVLYVLRGEILPWLRHPIPEKAAWLNLPFLCVRTGGSLLLLAIACAAMVAANLRADKMQQVTARTRSLLTRLSILVVLLYVLAFTFMALDLVMSLSPRWYSTMLPPYFFVSNLYASLAALILLGLLVRRSAGAGKYLGAAQFRDLGNLMLGFGMLSIGLFYAQFLTIWYGNIPEETGFIIARYYAPAWRVFSWAAFGIAYGLPFFLLQSRWLKQRPGLLALVALVALVGVWLERCVMVVPSLAPTTHWLGLTQVMISLGFLGAFGFTTLAFLARVAPVSKAGVDIELSDGVAL